MPASVVAIFKDSGNARLCCCDIQGQWSVVVMPASVVAIYSPLPITPLALQDNDVSTGQLFSLSILQICP